MWEVEIKEQEEMAELRARLRAGQIVKDAFVTSFVSSGCAGPSMNASPTGSALSLDS